MDCSRFQEHILITSTARWTCVRELNVRPIAFVVVNVARHTTMFVARLSHLMNSQTCQCRRL